MTAGPTQNCPGPWWINNTSAILMSCSACVLADHEFINIHGVSTSNPILTNTFLMGLLSSPKPFLHLSEYLQERNKWYVLSFMGVRNTETEAETLVPLANLIDVC